MSAMVDPYLVPELLEPLTYCRVINVG
jgi:hypothetical protein